MNRIARLLDVTTTTIDDNRVEVIAGTSQMARDGNIVDMRGLDIGAFLRSGTILWSHDPKLPVGIPISGRVDAAGNLRLVIEFAPDGASVQSDETKNLVRAGIVRNMSIGFKVIEAKPLEPNKPRSGSRVTRSELWECSFVSIPADTGAVVTARGNEDAAADRAKRLRQVEVRRLTGQAHLNGCDAGYDHRQRQVEVRKRGPGVQAARDSRRCEVLKRR